MAIIEDIHYLSAVEITNKIKSKEFTVEAVVRSFINRIKKYNPIINAVTDIRTEEDIIKEAREKDRMLSEGKVLGELHGLPMTVKDGFNVKGLKSSYGHPLYKNNIAQEDAELIKRLKNAGAIIIGKTNLPLLSIDWQSTNFWFGQTNNPYDLSRVPGGSSGGSAASVAAGFSPLELGSDAGGSIRVPAHFCGICGIRTTEQALSNRGQYKFPNKPQGHRLLTVSGPMAKNVDDLLLAMKVLWNSGKLLAEIPPVDFNSTSWNGEKLKIAYSESINNVEVDKEYLSIFLEFVKKIQGNGHEIINDHPVYNENLGYHIHGKLLGFEIDASSPTPHLLTKPIMYTFLLLKYRDKRWAKGVANGIGISSKDYMKSLEEKEKITDTYTRFFEKYDIWLTPVASFGAFKHQNTGVPFIVNGKKVPYTDAMAGFNFTTALSGHPIVVIPIGFTSENLPVGVQIHSKKWNDKKVLEIARFLEKFTPGFQLPTLRK